MRVASVVFIFDAQSKKILANPNLKEKGSKLRKLVNNPVYVLTFDKLIIQMKDFGTFSSSSADGGLHCPTSKTFASY